MGGQVFVSGDHACVATDQPGLQIVNVANPSAPTVVATTNFNRKDDFVCRDVFVVGNRAYVVGYSLGLRILDVSDPANPVQINSVSNNPIAVWVQGSYAYLASTRRLLVVDVSNPQALQTVGIYSNTIWAQDVRLFVDVSHAYVDWAASYGSGPWDIISITNPAAPVRVAETNGSGAIGDIEVRSNLVFLAIEGGSVEAWRVRSARR